MDCDKIEILLSEYLDSRLTPEESADFETHINTCEKCERMLNEYKALLAELRELPMEELPDGFHDTLMAHINGFVPRTRSFSLRGISFRKYTAVAAGIIVTLITLTALGSVISRVTGGKPSTSYVEWMGTAQSSLNSADMAAAGGEAGGVLYESAESELRLSREDTGSLEAPDNGAARKTSREADEEVPSAQAYGNVEVIVPILDASPYIASASAGDGAAISEPAADIASRTAMTAAAPVSSDKYIRSSTIAIRCENLTEATNVINLLSGYNTSSYQNFTGDGSGAYGYAEFTRWVDDWAYINVMDTLRQLGVVERENESQTSLTGEYLDYSIYLNNTQGEIDRLSKLFEASATLDNIIYIDSRISRLAVDSDRYQGRLNEIDTLSQGHTINIQITAAAPEDDTRINQGFTDRLRRAFVVSLRATRGFMEGAVILIFRLVIPVTVLAVFSGAIWFLNKRIRKRWKK